MEELEYWKILCFHFSYRLIIKKLANTESQSKENGYSIYPLSRPEKGPVLAHFDGKNSKLAFILEVSPATRLTRESSKTEQNRAEPSFSDQFAAQLDFFCCLTGIFLQPNWNYSATQGKGKITIRRKIRKGLGYLEKNA